MVCGPSGNVLVSSCASCSGGQSRVDCLSGVATRLPDRWPSRRREQSLSLDRMRLIDWPGALLSPNSETPKLRRMIQTGGSRSLHFLCDHDGESNTMKMRCALGISNGFLAAVKSATKFEIQIIATLEKKIQDCRDFDSPVLQDIHHLFMADGISAGYRQGNHQMGLDRLGLAGRKGGSLLRSG